MIYMKNVALINKGNILHIYDNIILGGRYAKVYLSSYVETVVELKLADNLILDINSGSSFGEQICSLVML